MTSLFLKQVLSDDSEPAKPLDWNGSSTSSSKLHGDPAIGQELLAFLDQQSFGRAAELQTTYRRMDREFSRILNELDEYNADFEALQMIRNNSP